MKDALATGSSFDAAIIGGGVVGLTIARELAQRRISVVLLERGKLGREASWAAAGMLAPQAEADRMDDFFRLAAASRDLYPQFAQALREETGIDVELDQTGTLYLAFDEREAEELESRFQWQQQAGLSAEKLTAAEARSLEPQLSADVRMALRFPRDWQVENRRLIAALARSAHKLGAALLQGVEARAVVIRDDRVQAVETAQGCVHVRFVVLASGAWTNFLELGRPQSVRVEPVRGQMICLEASLPIVSHVVYSRRGYIVPRRDGRVLAGSTVERVGFDKTVTARGLCEIARHALEISPEIGNLSVTETWAGLRPHAPGNRPIIGPDARVQGLLYATGHYRNGILLAPITAKIIGALIGQEEPSPLAGAFAPRDLSVDGG